MPFFVAYKNIFFFFFLLLADGGAQSAYKFSLAHQEPANGRIDWWTVLHDPQRRYYYYDDITRGRRRRDPLFKKNVLFHSPSRYYADIFYTVRKAPRENRQTFLSKSRKKIFPMSDLNLNQIWFIRVYYMRVNLKKGWQVYTTVVIACY